MALIHVVVVDMHSKCKRKIQSFGRNEEYFAFIYIDTHTHTHTQTHRNTLTHSH